MTSTFPEIEIKKLRKTGRQNILKRYNIIYSLSKVLQSKFQGLGISKYLKVT